MAQCVSNSMSQLKAAVSLDMMAKNVISKINMFFYSIGFITSLIVNYKKQAASLSQSQTVGLFAKRLEYYSLK